MRVHGPVAAISLPALPPDLFMSENSFSSHLNSPSRLTVFIALGTVITGISLILLPLLILLIRQKRKEMRKSTVRHIVSLPLWKKDLISSPGSQLKEWKRGSSMRFYRFTYKDIKKATDDFSTIIGRGGFGTVYKARFNNGLIAAVKKVNVVSKHSHQEFSREMEFLSRLRHRHLVTLRGFCIRKQQRFLVYEYMENGSLKEHLQGSESKTTLTWRTRLQIAIDVASALEYLHCYCDPPLCHRDIKSSNILLDKTFMAKVADFGLAHPAPETVSGIQQITTDVRGTPGYMDPEYVITQRLTDKSDIYSYGVLLLELITGRAAVQDNINLVEWSQRYVTEKASMRHIIDPDLKYSYDAEELASIISLIKMCTRKEGSLRPTIQQVMRWLHEKLDLNNADALLQTSVFSIRSQDPVEKYVRHPIFSNDISDEIGSLSSTATATATATATPPLSPYTVILSADTDCCVSFRFETTPPVSPIPLTDVHTWGGKETT